jgi:dienelactone hydrolase
MTTAPECCPKGSIPSRSAISLGITTNCRGEEIQLNPTVKAYVTKPAQSTSNHHHIRGGIILFHDIFGYQNGRTRYVADEIANWGYLVIAPDFFGNDYPYGTLDRQELSDIFQPGKILSGSWTLVQRLRMPWLKIESILKDHAIPWLRSNGCADLKLGMFGFCWGAWAMMRAAAWDDFCCGVGAHPSPDIQMLQTTGPTLAKMIEDVRIPLLFLMAQNDPSWWKPGGKSFAVIEKNNPGSKSVEFRTMIHGWMTRGDTRVPSVQAESNRAMLEAKVFLDARFPESLNPSARL